MVRQRAATQEERYKSAFETLERDGWAGDPQWLRELRREALARFQALGFPTARRGNEEWKYTDILPIARTPFDLTVDRSAKVKASDVERFHVGSEGWCRLVFIDGRFSKKLSQLPKLATNAVVTSLAEAVATKSDVLKQHLASYAAYNGAAFTALNTAFVDDGAFIYVPDGVFLEQPLQLLFIAMDEDAMSAPRSLVVLGKDTKATIVESYAGPARGRYFVNAVSEVMVGPGSKVNHFRIQEHGHEAFHVGTTQVRQERDSTINSVVMDAGGALVRNDLNVDLAGENASCVLNGLYMVDGSQHVDNQVIIDHQQPYTTSRELYKGILDGRSRAVFHGSITVREGARKADAHQTDRNLLLSNDCEADTKPALWIYCDDVKCGHGAASGQIDERALFYLRSRGLDQETARRLLIRAFASEVIDTVELGDVHAYIEKVFAQVAKGFGVGEAR